MFLKFLDKLDRKYGKFAIRNLMIYIAAGNLAVFLLSFMFHSLPNYLMLIPSLVLKGEWRLSHLFLSPRIPMFFLFCLQSTFIT